MTVVELMKTKHSPGPWEMSGPMGTEHLRGQEPWFYIYAEHTLHLRVVACSDGYIRGENEANARLIAAAPELLESLQALLAEYQGTETMNTQKARDAIAKAVGCSFPT